MMMHRFTNLLLMGASCTALVAGTLLLAREIERRRVNESEVRRTIELPYGDGTAFIDNG